MTASQQAASQVLLDVDQGGGIGHGTPPTATAADEGEQLLIELQQNAREQAGTDPAERAGGAAGEQQQAEVAYPINQVAGGDHSSHGAMEVHPMGAEVLLQQILERRCQRRRGCGWFGCCRWANCGWC